MADLKGPGETVVVVEMAGGIPETVIDTTAPRDTVKVVHDAAEAVTNPERPRDGTNWGSVVEPSFGQAIRQEAANKKMGGGVPQRLSDDDHRNHGKWE